MNILKSLGLNRDVVKQAREEWDYELNQVAEQSSGYEEDVDRRLDEHVQRDKPEEPLKLERSGWHPLGRFRMKD